MKRTPLRRVLANLGWVAPALVPMLLSCGGGGGDDIPEGGECQVCRSTAPQCNAGLTCSRFQGNFTYYLCAAPSTSSCSVPF